MLSFVLLRLHSQAQPKSWNIALQRGVYGIEHVTGSPGLSASLTRPPVVLCMLCCKACNCAHLCHSRLLLAHDLLTGSECLCIPTTGVP